MKTDKDLLRLIGAGSDTPSHVACRCFAADLRRVYEAGKEELRQQLANRELEVQHVLGKVVLVEQQLSAALAACKVKDEALLAAKWMIAHPDNVAIIERGIAIQPDDSALKAWLGEPVAWKHDDPKRHDAITDSVKELLHRANSEYMHRPIDKTEHYTIPLYSPKGLK